MTSSGRSTAQLAAELKKSVRSRSARSVITGLRDNLDGVDFTPLKEVDITDPILLEPFKYGWKRELTYRASLSQQVADVYYHPPEKYRLLHQLNKASEKSQLVKKKTAGRKLSKTEIRKWTSITRGRPLRSNVEVAEFLKLHYLDSALTVSNFSFTKKPFGLNDPEKEVIRFAKKRERRWRKDEVRRGDKSSARIRSKLALQNSEKTSGSSQTKRVYRRKNVESPSSELNESRKHMPGMLSISRKRPVRERRLPSRIRSPVASTSVEPDNPKSKHNSCVHRKKSGRRKILSPPMNHSASMENPMSSPSQIILCETSISSTSDSSSDNSPTLTEEDLVESYNPLDPINLCSETPSSIMSFKYPSLEYRDADTSVEESITAYQNQDSSMMNPWSEDIDEMHTKPCLLEPKIEFVDEELYNDASDLALGKPFHFKVAIRRENAPDEKAQIRRFSTTFDDTPIFPHLCTTLRTICPDLRDETFTLHWQDTDGDDVLVASCLELREALSMMKYHRLIRFDLTVHNANDSADCKNIRIE